MNFENKKVFVTGAGGFIGSHLVERLVKLGAKVKTLVLYDVLNSCGWLDNVSQEILTKIEIVVGDVCDPFFIRKAMEGCEIVFHLAALISIPYSYHSPQSYVSTNISGTLNLLEAARDLGIQKFIHTSTSEVYGSAQYVPIDENHPLQPQSPYSASKIAADQLALSFYYSFSTPISIIRPFNTYGPRQTCRAVIPTIITQIAAGKEEIRLGSLRPTRDFSFVEDTVEGFVSIAKSDNSIGKVINIGSNFEISIGEVVDLISNIMGKKVTVIQEDQRIRPINSEVERLFAKIELAKESTDWSPKFHGHEGFKLGLQKTIDWYMNKNNRKYFKSDTYNI